MEATKQTHPNPYVFWAGPYIGWIANYWEDETLIASGHGDSAQLALDDLNERIRIDETKD